MLRSFLLRKLRPNCLKIVRCKSSGGVSLNVEMLSQDKTDFIYIEAISQLGFRLNNKVRIVGPMVAFPKTLLQWKVNKPEDLTPAAFSLFTLLEPKLDLLIVGVGDKDRLINPNVMDYLRTQQQVIQVLPTSQAVGLFNFLNREDRYVAAALIPPQTVVDAMSIGIEETVDLLGGNDYLYGKPFGDKFKGKDIEEEESDIENIDTELKGKTSLPKTPGGLFYRGADNSSQKTPGGTFDKEPSETTRSTPKRSVGESDSYKAVSKDSVEERRRKIMERLQASKKSDKKTEEEGTPDNDKPS